MKARRNTTPRIGLNEAPLPADQQPDLDEVDNDNGLPDGLPDGGLPDDDVYPNTTRPSDAIQPRYEAVVAATDTVRVGRDMRRRAITIKVPLASPCGFYLAEDGSSQPRGFLLDAGDSLTLGTRAGFTLTPAGAASTSAPAIVTIIAETWWTTSTDDAEHTRRRHASLLGKLVDIFAGMK